MTADNYSPSIPPSARSDFSGLLQFVLTKFLQRTDDMLPAIVKSYNRATNRAQVQPMISIVSTDNTVIQRGVIASVPVLQLGGGGFVFSCPLNPGDLGWIKANDRDISLFLQTFQNTAPNTARLHTFENGMFIPDTMFKSVTINAEDAGNAVLQSLDGTVRIAIWPDKVKITAPTVEVECTTAQVNASGGAEVTSPTITLTASTEIILDSPLTSITGALGCTDGSATATFAGPVIADQTIVATGNITGAGTSLHTHVHSGVMSGGADTGPPV